MSNSDESRPSQNEYPHDCQNCQACAARAMLGAHVKRLENIKQQTNERMLEHHTLPVDASFDYRSMSSLASEPQFPRPVFSKSPSVCRRETAPMYGIHYNSSSAPASSASLPIPSHPTLSFPQIPTLSAPRPPFSSFPHGTLDKL